MSSIKNGLSFDIEDMHQIAHRNLTGHLSDPAEVVASTKKILSILAKNKTKATFNILGLVAEAFPELVREINKVHEIGSHGYYHIPIRKQNPHEFTQDLQKSIILLEKITGSKIKGYRAPEWITAEDQLWAIDILAKQGLSYDSSILPIKNGASKNVSVLIRPYFLPKEANSQFVEIPPFKVKFAGRFIPMAKGRYLRLLPYWFLKRIVKKMNKRGIPVIIDIHSYEFDYPRQSHSWPKWKNIASLKTWGFGLLYRLGRKSVEKKLINLCRDFNFVSLEEIAMNELKNRFPKSGTNYLE